MAKNTSSNQISQSDEFNRWSNIMERSKAIENYTSILNNADQSSINQVGTFTKQIQTLYKGSIIVYIVTLIAIGIVFGMSIFFVLYKPSDSVQFTIGGIGIPLCLIALFILAYKAPLKPARQIIGEVIKMQVVFLGYLRQLNQADIGFKQTIATLDKIKANQFQKTFSETQQILEKSLDDINLLLEEF